MYNINELNDRNSYLIEGQKGIWNYCSEKSTNTKHSFHRPPLRGHGSDIWITLSSEEVKVKIWCESTPSSRFANLESVVGM